MAIYSTRARMTGLSGIDTESMITQLMQAESQKLYKLQKKNTSLVWKQEAYWSVSDKLKSFQDKFLSVSLAGSIRKPSSFNSNTAKVLGNSDAVSVTVNEKSTPSKHELHVLKLATKNVYTSNTTKTEITSDNTFSYTNIQDGDGFTLNFDGTNKEILFTAADIAGMTSDADFETVLNNKLEAAFGHIIGGTTPKVTASVTGGALSIKPNEVGHNLTVYDTKFRSNDIVLDSSFSTGTLTNLEGQSFTVNVTENGVTKEVTFDFSSYSSGTPLTLNEFYKKVNNTLNENGVSAEFKLVGSDITLRASGPNTSSVTITDKSAGGIMSILQNAGGTAGTATIAPSSSLMHFGNIKNGESNFYNTYDTLKDIFGTLFPAGTETASMVINGALISLKETDTLTDMANKINASSAGVEFNYNKLTGEFSLSSKKEGAGSKISFDDANANTFKALMTEKAGSGSDSQFMLDGILTTRESNTFTYEGITFSFNSVTTSLLAGVPQDPPVIIEVTNDTSNTTDTIKGFIEGYNELIKSLNGMINEPRAKAGTYDYYDPLTEDEKKSMSESEIKIWEEKAKQGVLYRDPLLSSITRELRTLLYQPVTLSDGSKISLTQLGITTGDYKEEGSLKLDEEKLKKALESFGSEKISEFFAKSSSIPFGKSGMKQSRYMDEGIADRINDVIKYAIDYSGTITKKAGTQKNNINNDLSKQITAQGNKITDMLKYLYNKENHYYQMFSKMEAAIMKNDSQMANLQSMLGIQS